MRMDIDENGNAIDILKDRNEEIKEKLAPALNKLLDEKKLDKKGIIRFGYRMTTQIDNALRSYGLMTAEEVANIDYDTIESNWNNFRDLIAYYNLYFEVVANKQLFCAFMRINNRIYTQLEKSPDEDIRALMASINDSFIGLGFAASESGNAPTTATKIRLGAKGVGHDVVSASDEMVANAIVRKTPLELEKELQAIMGSEPKKLN